MADGHMTDQVGPKRPYWQAFLTEAGGHPESSSGAAQGPRAHSRALAPGLSGRLSASVPGGNGAAPMSPVRSSVPASSSRLAPTLPALRRQLPAEPSLPGRFSIRWLPSGINVDLAVGPLAEPSAADDLALLQETLQVTGLADYRQHQGDSGQTYHLFTACTDGTRGIRAAAQVDATGRALVSMSVSRIEAGEIGAAKHFNFHPPALPETLAFPVVNPEGLTLRMGEPGEPPSFEAHALLSDGLMPLDGSVRELPELRTDTSFVYEAVSRGQAERSQGAPLEPDVQVTIEHRAGRLLSAYVSRQVAGRVVERARLACARPLPKWLSWKGWLPEGSPLSVEAEVRVPDRVLTPAQKVLLQDVVAGNGLRMFDKAVQHSDHYACSHDLICIDGAMLRVHLEADLKRRLSRLRVEGPAPAGQGAGPVLLDLRFTAPRRSAREWMKVAQLDSPQDTLLGRYNSRHGTAARALALELDKGMPLSYLMLDDPVHRPSDATLKDLLHKMACRDPALGIDTGRVDGLSTAELVRCLKDLATLAEGGAPEADRRLRLDLEEFVELPQALGGHFINQLAVQPDSSLTAHVDFAMAARQFLSFVLKTMQDESPRVHPYIGRIYMGGKARAAGGEKEDYSPRYPGSAEILKRLARLEEDHQVKARKIIRTLDDHASPCDPDPLRALLFQDGIVLPDVPRPEKKGMRAWDGKWIQPAVDRIVARITQLNGKAPPWTIPSTLNRLVKAALEIETEAAAAAAARAT